MRRAVLPDMRNMKITVRVHESTVNKVKKEQAVIIRVDAFPDRIFTGKISRVAQLATSGWSSTKTTMPMS